MEKKLLSPILISLAVVFVSFIIGGLNKAQAQNQLGGHFGIVQPIVTLDDGDLNDEFDPHTIGFPIGITVRQNDKFAFDAEFVPLITFANSTVPTDDVAGSEDELDRIILLVHPGFLFGIGEKLTFGTRLAYELGESGRYGFTPLLNKGFSIGNVPVFAELVLPVRMGSDRGFTVTGAIHLGVGF